MSHSAARARAGPRPGVAAALLDAFRAGGLRAVALSVAGTNAPATGLYESAGMTPDSRAEHW